MRKTLHSDQNLLKRLSGYAASAGALFALSPLVKGEIIHSGIQNLEAFMPDGYVELDIDGDTVIDFAFQMYGESSFMTYGSYFIAYRFGYAAIFNPKTDGYNNSWIARSTVIPYTMNSLTYSDVYTIAKGLNAGDPINSEASMWSDLSYPYIQGLLGGGYMVSYYYGPGISGSYGIAFGDFIGQARFVGVKFWIGMEQHYGWIRVKLGELLDPLRIIDWAYETEAGVGITAGDAGDVTPPEITLTGGGGTVEIPLRTITITSDEEISGIDIDKILVINGNASNLQVVAEGLSYTVNITAEEEGVVEVILPEGIIEDMSGNINAQVATSWTYDRPEGIGISDMSGISVYPNPTSSELNIVLDQPADIQLVSMNGSIVLMKRNVQNETLDISHISKGLYILKVMSSQKTSIHKIVIE